MVDSITKSFVILIYFISNNSLVLVFLLVILGILLLTSFILALNAVLVVAKLVISSILSSISLILVLYTPFLTTTFFATPISLLKSTGTDNNLSTSNLSTLLFKLFKTAGTFSSLSMSNSSTSDFELAKSTFLAILDASAPAVFYESAFVT